MSERQRVAVVTGGGAGIGAAIAEALGRSGWHVVTMDPLVTLDGNERLPEPAETTAGRITAAGGSAEASGVSVTDGDAVRELFAGLVDERGGLDAVVNVAGITRPTGFAAGTEEDWLGVLAVHLSGYLNVLGAALPLMAAAGYGRILGVTSGSGWRAADAGAYSCAKRAVASLTWQLGRCAPPGVAVNAVSPIAATRMVAAALERVRQASASAGASASGGLSLAAMPEPDELGPLGAHLVGDGFGWCSGRVLFAGGSEVALVDEPRFLEVVRTDGVASVAAVLAAVVPGALAPAEAAQASGGGSNARFAAVYADAPAPTPGAASSCALVTDRDEVRGALTAALAAREVTCHLVETLSEAGPVDAVVVALAGGPAAAAGGAAAWAQVLAEHDGAVAGIHADARWVQAVADHAAATGRSIRLVTITDATTAGGRSRAQSAAQLARVGRKATGDQVVPFAIADEGGTATGELVAHLLCHPAAAELAGAELAVGPGWVGLRSHPRPGGSITYGGPSLPEWFDGALEAIVEAR